LPKTQLQPVDSGARRKRRSPEDLRNKILQAAGDEFRRCGYAGATTAAIARQADVTEAQLFRYFGTKAQLFREAIFKPLDEQLSNFVASHMAPDSAESVQEQSALYIDELQRFVAENSEMLTSLIVAQTYAQESGAGVSAIASLGDYFDRGAATMTERLKSEPKVAPKLMVRVSFAAVLACTMFKDWIFPPGLATEAEIRAAVSDFVREGIGANHDFGRGAEAGGAGGRTPNRDRGQGPT
jgi:AcrR family transcriptional regulator